MHGYGKQIVKIWKNRLQISHEYVDYFHDNDRNAIMKHYSLTPEEFRIIFEEG